MLSKLLLTRCCHPERQKPSSLNAILRIGGSVPNRLCVPGPRGQFSKRYISTKTDLGNNGVSGLRRLLSYAGPEKRVLAVALGLLGIGSVATVGLPFFVGRTIDTIHECQDKETMKARLISIVSIVGGLTVVGGMATFGRVYLMNLASQRITNRIRAQAHAAIIRQDTAFFDTQKSGQLLSRLSSDAAQMGNSLTQNVSEGLRALFAILGSFGMMFYTSSQLSYVSVMIVAPVAVMARWYSKKLSSLAANVQNSLAESSGVAEEQFSNIRTVRMFSKEQLEVERYQKTLDAVLVARTEEARKQARFYAGTGPSGNVIIMAVLFRGGMLMAEGQISIGSLTSFLIYAAYVGVYMSSVFHVFSEVMKALGASQKLWALIDRQPAILPDVGKHLDSVRGQIDFQGVSFRYPTRESDILNGVDLHIPSGKVTAVVGPSGSGKSTLASLILRLYDPTKGTVFFDGHNVAELNPTFLRNQIGVVAQEPVLFSATIRENIAYGSAHPVTAAEIEAAARVANAYNFITEFPQGFETLVGERGVMLSGGQKQRVAIARAVLRRPKILILDEATSSLDAISERHIQDVLEKFSQGRTVIVIAHRLSTIQRADNIVVLKAGRIVEQGRFDDLLQIEDGVFHDLVTHQMRS